jgi:hypothetical protein
MKFGLLAAAAVVFGLIGSAASANTNCAALNGSPMMCLKNQAAMPIVAVQAVSSTTMGNNWVSIPGGPIQPGDVSIVRFPVFSGGCFQSVFVKTASGKTHMIPHVDVCHNTSLVISGW